MKTTYPGQGELFPETLPEKACEAGSPSKASCSPSPTPSTARSPSDREVWRIDSLTRAELYGR